MAHNSKTFDDYIRESLSQKEHTMEYFDLDKELKAYMNKPGKTYSPADPALKWYKETTKKLEYLVGLLQSTTGQSLTINYTERPNSRAGKGKMVFKDYILVGFRPDQAPTGNNFFIKLCFHRLSDYPTFQIQMDTNWKKGKNLYPGFNEYIQKQYTFNYIIDDAFPREWDTLLDKITPDVITVINKFMEIVNASIKEPSNSKGGNEFLNKILFGPPGTGKTYFTINHALKIVDLDFYLKNRLDREALVKRFSELRYNPHTEQGQIAFITFHQSMSYEEFIEGFKPIKAEGENSPLGYAIEPGLFKKICSTASENKTALNFEEAYNKYVEEVLEKGHIELQTPYHKKKFKIEINANRNSVVIPFTEAATRMTLTKQLIKDCILYGKDNDWKPYIVPVSNYIKEKYNVTTKEKVSNLPYVLIIDEINRGNVANIFGELITLIEPDKRAGNTESLEVILPYSKEPFSVPSNLFIIGTMNTADRSVEALDSALRRRFHFIEMPPQPELLSPQRMIWQLLWDYKDIPWEDENYIQKEKGLFELLGVSEELDKKDKYELWEKMVKEGPNEDQVDWFKNYKYEGINLQKLLEKINDRIEKLLDKDHLIGHSYFISIKSYQELKGAFQNKILPLLQEYFYGDYGKIGLVLGKGFVYEIISDEKNQVFSDFEYEGIADLEEKIVYKITNLDTISDIDFRKAIKDLMNEGKNEQKQE